MRETARFSIEAVVDLPSRMGLLASGKILAGEIAPGATLRDETTGGHVTVLAVEFESPADRCLGRTTLLLERTAPTPVVTGRVLVSPT